MFSTAGAPLIVIIIPNNYINYRLGAYDSSILILYRAIHRALYHKNAALRIELADESLRSLHKTATSTVLLCLFPISMLLATWGRGGRWVGLVGSRRSGEECVLPDFCPTSVCGMFVDLV